VVQASQDLGLALEAETDPLVRVAGHQHLERHLTARLILLGEVDDSHAAATELAEDAEGADALRQRPGDVEVRVDRWAREERGPRIEVREERFDLGLQLRVGSRRVVEPAPPDPGSCAIAAAKSLDPAGSFASTAASATSRV
jgi:hypothetical protein